MSLTYDELMDFAFAENDLGDEAVAAGDYNAAIALFHSCKAALALARLALESDPR